MSDSKNQSSAGAGTLYLSFHLIGDSSYKQEKKKLETILQSLCGAQELILDHEDAIGPHDREVVYCVPAPSTTDTDSAEAYFKNLREIFQETQRYLPSFTQGTEALT